MTDLYRTHTGLVLCSPNISNGDSDMLSRHLVYRDTERDYQDAKRGNSAREEESSRELGGIIVIMDAYLAKAKAAYAGPHPVGRNEALEQIRKVVAFGVLAMEHHGMTELVEHLAEGVTIHMGIRTRSAATRRARKNQAANLAESSSLWTHIWRRRKPLTPDHGAPSRL